jgi:SPW repeat-containing protein
MEDWSKAKLCDVVNLLLGTTLFFSPWLFSLSAGAPRQIASILGLFIAVLSIAALAAFAVWEEWLNLVAGLWLIAAPWLLGFEDSDAGTVDVAIGIVVVVLATFEIWLAMDRRQGGPTGGGMAAQG